MTSEGYDVLRLIEHGKHCYISSEYVEGRILAGWLKENPDVTKEQLFSLIREIANQLGMIHKCRKKPYYQYVNPYSIVVAEEGKLYFLDMEAGSNEKQLRFMQRRTVRECFLPEEEPCYQKASTELDIYGMGKTIQYLLAVSKPEPPLNRREERRFLRILSKCLKNLLSSRLLSEGPDMIYLPEITFDLHDFSRRVKELLDRKTSIVVAVSEGIRIEDGTYVCELGNSIDFVDAFGHKQLSGTATYLASFIAGEIGCKTRAIELSTLQRAASHAASRVDILEAYQVGGAAVKAADEGDSGKMVVLQRLSDDPYQCGTEVKDVHKIANDEKLVPRNWVSEDGTYVTNEFISYVRPLIQGDVSPVMVDGIPRHLYTPRELSYRQNKCNM